MNTKRQTLIFTMAGILMFVVALGIARYTVEGNREQVRQGNVSKKTQVILGTEPYAVPFLIDSVNLESKTMVLYLRSYLANQDIKTRVKFDPSVTVSRSDVIIENGIVVGATAATEASLQDLKPGARGFARIHLLPDQTYVVRSILFGIPFPRP